MLTKYITSPTQSHFSGLVNMRKRVGSEIHCFSFMSVFLPSVANFLIGIPTIQRFWLFRSALTILCLPLRHFPYRVFGVERGFLLSNWETFVQITSFIIESVFLNFSVLLDAWIQHILSHDYCYSSESQLRAIRIGNEEFILISDPKIFFGHPT